MTDGPTIELYAVYLMTEFLQPQCLNELSAMAIDDELEADNDSDYTAN